MPQSNPRSEGVTSTIDTVADKAKEYASNASEFVGHTKDKVKQWAHDAKENISDAATATGEMAHNAKDKVQELATTAMHHAGDAMHSATDEITHAIRKYPIQSVLLGAALGFLIVKATTKG